MRATRQSRLQLRLASSSFVALFLVAVGLLLWLSRDYHLQFDWTQGGRNTLSEASRVLLARLDRPVRITAFASEREGLRKGIRELVGRYQREKHDVTLDFVNPDTDPARVRAAGVRFDGELLVEYGQGHENLNQLNEETLTNALSRLGRSGERWIVFLSGHGERSPDRQANHDLSTWAGQLTKRGLKTRSLTLADNAQVPQNTAVLVVAGPRVKYLAGELKQIAKYLSGGGSLLWLADPGPRYGLEPLAEQLGIEFQDGVIVDPVSQALTGGAATFVVATKYGAHPVVHGFNLMTLFPEAAAIRHHGRDWQAQTLLDTSPSSWAETAPLEEAVRFDAGKDVRGPLNIGVALTRKHDGREQRVAVLGDGDFLSNTYIGNGGNLDLGMNLVNWLSSDDAYINIPTRTAADVNLNLSRTAQASIALGFLILLPLALVGSGVGIWWRRRKR